MAGSTAVPSFWTLLATVALIWPVSAFGWSGTGGSPDDELAALSSFSRGLVLIARR